MAVLSLTIPDAIATRVLNDFAYQNGFGDNVSDINGNVTPNPMTKLQFSKNVLKTFIKNSCVAYESVQAAEAARITAITTANSTITLLD